VPAKMTMREYDSYTIRHLPEKIPDWSNSDHRRRLGDSVYDFSFDPPTLRQGVHQPENTPTDLGGKSVLVSDNFYYFGDHPPRLPDDLQSIVQQGQGHRSVANEPYERRFVSWIGGLELGRGPLYGQPQLDLFAGANEERVVQCARQRSHESEIDELVHGADLRQQRP
jgi:hypothetical protein